MLRMGRKLRLVPGRRCFMEWRQEGSSREKEAVLQQDDRGGIGMIGFGNASQGVPCCNAEAGIAGIKLAEELLNAFPGGRTGSRAKQEINHILHALFRKNTIYMESFQKFPHRHVHGTSFINRKFFFRFCFQNNGSKAGRWAYGKGKLCQQLVNVFFCVSVRLGKQKGQAGGIFHGMDGFVVSGPLSFQAKIPGLDHSILDFQRIQRLLNIVDCL